MAARFWVGGAGNWSDITHWATVSGGAGGSAVPTSADDVTLDGNSGTGTITVDVASNSKSFDATSYTGGLTLVGTLTVAGNLTMGAGMTFTPGTITLFLIATSGSWNITTNGKQMGPTQVGGGGSTATTWTLQDNFTSNSTLSIAGGTFNTNNKAIQASVFTSSSAIARTLTLGSSIITAVNPTATAIDFGTVTNLSITANTATFKLTGVNAGFNTGAVNFNGASVQFTGGGSQGIFGAGSATFRNLTVTGTVAKTDSFSFSLNTTFTGTVAFQGLNAATRLLVFTNSGAGTGGTAPSVTLTIATHGAHQYVDFQDIIIAGAAGTLTGTSIGDALGNTNITFSPSVTQTWQGTTGGTWSDVTKWTSRVPLPQDDVVISSAFGANPQITMDMPRVGRNVSFAGSTTTSGQLQLIQNVTIFIFGNLTLAAPVFFTSNANNVVLGGRGTHTFTTNGGTATGGGRGFFIRAVTGSYTLMDNMITGWGASWTFTSGTFNANGFNFVGWAVLILGSTIRPVTVNMGSGTWTLLANAQPTTVWNVVPASVTLNAGTSTIILNGSGTGTVLTFSGGGQTYYTLQWKPVGTGQLNITGNNTFTNLDVETSTTAKTLSLPASGLQIINGALTLQGSVTQSLSLVSSTPGTSTTVRSSGALNDVFISPSADVIIQAQKIGGGLSSLKSGTAKFVTIRKVGGGLTSSVSGINKIVTTSKIAGAKSFVISGVVKSIIARKTGGGIIQDSAGGLQKAAVIIAKIGGTKSSVVAGGVHGDIIRKSGGAKSEIWTGVISHRLLNVKTGGLINAVVAGGTYRALKLKAGGSISSGRTGGTYRKLGIHTGGGRSSALVGAQRVTGWRKSGGAASNGRSGALHRILFIKTAGSKSTLASGSTRFTIVIRVGGGKSVGLSGAVKTSFFEFSKIGGSHSALVSGTDKQLTVDKSGGGIVVGKGGGHPIFITSTKYKWLVEAGMDRPTLLTANSEVVDLDEAVIKTPVLLKTRI